MLTAAQLANKARDTAEPFPQVDELADLYVKGVELYPGQVMMIAGQPGSQKSGFALWLVSKLKANTLYFSCDSDAATMFARVAAIHTGVQYRTIRRDLEEEDRLAFYQDQVGAESRIVFSDDASPGIQEMQDTVSAWVEMYDTWPDVIVVDNLTDLDKVAENEHQGNKELLKEFKLWSRQTGAMILVLHHVSEGASRPDKPGPRSAIQGKPGQTPALIFSVALEGDQFHIATVKDRHSGPIDANGGDYVTLVADPARNQFRRQQSLDQQAARLARWREENLS